MNIAVIILNYNSIAQTINCINSFKKCKKNQYQFIIIDNNSQEEILEEIFLSNEIIKITNIDQAVDLKVNYYYRLSENFGYSFGNNEGLKIAKKLGYEYAIVANPDTEVIDIENFEQIFDIDKNFLAVYPKVIDSNGNLQSIYIYNNFVMEIFKNLFYPIYYGYYKFKRNEILAKSKNQAFIKIDFSIGCFIFFNLKKYETINYFDDNVFLYNEEKILMEKARKNNMNIYYSNILEVRHNHIYKNISKFSKKERKKSRRYYFQQYKYYPMLLIKIIEITELIKENIYDKIIFIIKKYL